MQEELELETEKPSRSSKQISMCYTGTFTVDGKQYEFKEGEPFSVSPKHADAFEREIKRRGILNGTVTN